MSSIKTKHLIRIEELQKAGKFREALQLVSFLEERQDLPLHHRLTIQILKGNILIDLGLFDEALKIAKFLRESKGEERHLLLVDILSLEAKALWHLGRLDNSLNLVVQGEQLLKSLADEQSPDFIRRTIRLTNCKGEIYWAQGNLDQALECFEQNLALGQHLNNKEEIAESLHNLAAIYHTKGDLDYALEHFQKSLALSEEHGNKQLFAATLLSIGSIYTTKGDLELALDYLRRSLKVFKELSNQHYIATSLRCIGRIYQRKGELNPALDYLEQSLVLFEEIGNRLYLSGVLFSLISVAIDKKDLDRAQKYLQQLQEINIQEENRSINQRCLLAEALIQKTNLRPKTKLEAQHIFAQVANETIVDHELTVIAILNLCELLIYELKLSSEQEILEELQPQITRLFDIAQQQQSLPLAVQTIWLRSQLALVELDVSKAEQLLHQAQTTATKHGLHRLAAIITKEQERLSAQAREWNVVSHHEVPILERLRRTRLEELLGLMWQNRVEHHFMQVHNIEMTDEKVEAFVDMLDKQYSS
ncbi:MAG: tetratricopeptide repeat protein [Candidatus Hodarchaeota archaeon]